MTRHSSRNEFVKGLMLHIASGLETIALRLEVIASRLEAIPLRLEAFASRLEAISISSSKEDSDSCFCDSCS